jgi:hypothetical protein
MSWLNNIKVCSEVYVFQADLYCEDCARTIAAQLDASASPNVGDSDSYPQGPYPEGGGEADDPHFCASRKSCSNSINVGNQTIGCPLGNSLTHDGAETLITSVLDLSLNSRNYERQLSRLYLKVWGDNLDHYRFECLRRVPAKFERLLPSSLDRLVKRLRGIPSHIMYQDENHVYITSRHNELVDLVRCAISDEGSFPSCEMASVPSAVADEVSPEELIRDAIDEGGWD